MVEWHIASKLSTGFTPNLPASFGNMHDMKDNSTRETWAAKVHGSHYNSKPVCVKVEYGLKTCASPATEPRDVEMEAAMAASVAPIAKPTSEAARAGKSLMPSPQNIGVNSSPCVPAVW